MAASFVINADDLGLAESATNGIIEGHRAGVITSASLVVTTPALDHALAAATDCPRLGIGLHFSLSAGRPIAPGEQVPDLIGPDGLFDGRFMSLGAKLLGPARRRLLGQIEVELEAQVQKLLSCGIVPDHINGERHIHLLPGIFELVSKAADRHGIPHVRVINDIGLRFVRLRDVVSIVRNGGFAKFLLLRALSKRALGKSANGRNGRVLYASMLFTGRMGLLLPRIWANPPAAAVEIAVHPGLPGEVYADGLGNEALAEYLQSADRLAELEECVALQGAARAAELHTFRSLYDSAMPGGPGEAEQKPGLETATVSPER